MQTTDGNYSVECFPTSENIKVVWTNASAATGGFRLEDLALRDVIANKEAYFPGVVNCEDYSENISSAF